MWLTWRFVYDPHDGVMLVFLDPSDFKALWLHSQISSIYKMLMGNYVNKDPGYNNKLDVFFNYTIQSQGFFVQVKLFF